MKVLGLIGGMSWESSAIYYQIVNQQVKKILGDLHSCKCLMYSVDFSDIEALQHSGDWDTLATLMIDAAWRLEKAGADIVVLCTNTMHKLAEQIQEAIHIPLLHIADATAEQIQQAGFNKIALLGTKFTMTEAFYKNRLAEQYGIEVIIPGEKEIDIVHRIIYKELVQGKVLEDSKSAYIRIIRELQEKGAQGVILGCTEITMLVKPSDVYLPVFDTTRIHAEKAVEWILSP